MHGRLTLILGILVCAACPQSASAAHPTGAGVRGLAPPSISGTLRTASSAGSSSTSSAESPVPWQPSDKPPAGRQLSSNRAIAIASALAKMRAVRARYKGSYGGAYLKGPGRWQVSFFSANGKTEIGQVIIADASGRVLEQWTGFQVAWTMARGYPGAFGRHVNSLYVWLPLCLLFVLPFFDCSPPVLAASPGPARAAVVLDLARVLQPRQHLRVGPARLSAAAVPAGADARAAQAPGAAAAARLRLLVPAPWLALGLVFLVAFRITLDVTDSNVIDVGYAGVIGAQRIVDGKSLYGSYPSDNEHGDTYGPANYAAYVPFEQIFGWSGTWDDLPAAHAAAIVFDLLAIGLLFLLGRRVRGPTLGIVLAYAWAPIRSRCLRSRATERRAGSGAGARDAARRSVAPPARGAFAALAGLTKFAPLAIVPVLATYRLAQTRAGALTCCRFLAASRRRSVCARSSPSPTTRCTRSAAHLVYQSDRDSPFSVWGLYGWQACTMP